jgi:phage shock protein A
MGLFEKTKNITDTDLRIVVQGSDDPSEALRRHILSLEESQRQLKSSQGFLERQRQWLESSAERKLSLAEEWAKRAAAAARQTEGSGDDLARHALLRKKELLRSMGEDRRQLEGLVGQLAEVERRLGQVRQKILKARAVRERLFGEGAAAVEPASAGAAAPPEPRPERPPTTLSAQEQREIDEELRDLKRRLDEEK